VHEMGIVASILDASFDAASKQGATRITEIKISVGELTEIQEFALEFAFESLTPDTMAEGATLSVTNIGARSRCGTCGIEFDHGRFEAVCPECGSFVLELLTGRELTIDSIEIDDGEDDEPIAESAETVGE